MHTLTVLANTYAAPTRPGPGSLDRDATVRYRRAVARLRWAEHHHRCVGLRNEAGHVLACADRFELEMVLDGRPIRCCGLGNICETEMGAGRHAAELVAQAVDEADAAGFDAVLVSSGEPYWPLPESFTPMPTPGVVLLVAESGRRGAPMVPVRSGERADLPHLASVRPLGTAGLRLARNPDLLDFSITRHRLRAALSAPGTSQVHFLVVEEGARAAAYVVVTASDQGWRLEECGDRDPAGARVGALLQVLIAREAAEQRPRITAALPPGFQPPQVSVTRAGEDGVQLWLKVLAPHLPGSPAADTRIAWWPADPPAAI